jgi:hypothetical protein
LLPRFTKTAIAIEVNPGMQEPTRRSHHGGRIQRPLLQPVDAQRNAAGRVNELRVKVEVHHTVFVIGRLEGPFVIQIVSQVPGIQTVVWSADQVVGLTVRVRVDVLTKKYAGLRKVGANDRVCCGTMRRSTGLRRPRQRTRCVAKIERRIDPHQVVFDLAAGNHSIVQHTVGRKGTRRSRAGCKSEPCGRSPHSSAERNLDCEQVVAAA